MNFDSSELIGLIPAAGKGTRLSLPFPKELYPIIQDNKYRPVSQSILEQIVFAGVAHIVFVVNEHKSQLLQYFGNGQRFKCDISYVVQEQPKPTTEKAITPGLAEAMDAGYHLVKDKIVVFGMPDTIITPKHIFKTALINLRKDYDGIFCLFKAEKPEKSGMVILSEDDQVLEIVDKPKQTNLEWMWGTIIWKSTFNEFLHDCIANRGIFEYGVIFNEALNSGLKFGGVRFPEGKYLDLGTVDDVVRVKASTD
ncbi:MAG: Glucose-1-phosphate thymidylyltransferase 2 [Firmicutes bacterium ADurb.Bin419]|nr:MAG: Glucose-1-phosphate thymidylyltransferase 2 [Firmicutes bacterium ADurb.Bin419]